MISILIEGQRSVHPANLITHADSTERDEVLSTQPIDCEKQLCPTKTRLTDDEVFHHEYFISLKHAQHGVVCIRICCVHDLFLPFLGANVLHRALGSSLDGEQPAQRS